MVTADSAGAPGFSGHFKESCRRDRPFL